MVALKSTKKQPY